MSEHGRTNDAATPGSAMIEEIKRCWSEVISSADKQHFPRYHSERRAIDMAFEDLIKFVDPFYVRELELHCGLCCRVPATIPGISDYAAREGLTPDEYVWREEGTLNRDTGQFACDACYIKLGMPSGPNGWRFGDAV